MPIDLDKSVARDPHTDADLRKVLPKLQGNILKGHGREHTINIFVTFRESVEVVRRNLIALAKRYVTSAEAQQTQTDDWLNFQVPGGLFGNLMLTAKGYRALGFTPAQLAAFAEAGNGPAASVKSNFLEGAHTHASELADPPVAKWDRGFRGDIHMLLLLADDDRAFLRREARAAISVLSTFADVVAVEHGDALRDANQEGIEHFGYADGRSQPVFLTTDLADEGATDVWNPVEPLKLVLREDKLAKDPTGDSFGSFYVFRKLEQNVRGFIARENDLADALGLKGEDRARAGAMAVGRFRDGTPLVVSPTDGFLPVKENNFRYDGKNEAKCPFHAHIRKTNPRGDIVAEFGAPEGAEREHRIVRRGITYGIRAAHPQDEQDISKLPSGDVGLLFACFQANIPNQFAFMQQGWANAEDFVRQRTGQDPVISQGGSTVDQTWPVAWGQAPTQKLNFGQFVTMKGGEFFFAPSMPFLASFEP
jgi:Dyp-type peroxidase family